MKWSSEIGYVCCNESCWFCKIVANCLTEDDWLRASLKSLERGDGFKWLMELSAFLTPMAKIALTFSSICFFCWSHFVEEDVELVNDDKIEASCVEESVTVLASLSELELELELSMVGLFGTGLGVSDTLLCLAVVLMWLFLFEKCSVLRGVEDDVVSEMLSDSSESLSEQS